VAIKASRQAEEALKQLEQVREDQIGEARRSGGKVRVRARWRTGRPPEPTAADEALGVEPVELMGPDTSH